MRPISCVFACSVGVVPSVVPVEENAESLKDLASRANRVAKGCVFGELSPSTSGSTSASPLSSSRLSSPDKQSNSANSQVAPTGEITGIGQKIFGEGFWNDKGLLPNVWKSTQEFFCRGSSSGGSRSPGSSDNVPKVVRLTNINKRDWQSIRI